MDPQQNDPTAAYQQFRAQILGRFGLGGQNSQQVSGPAMSGTTQRDRFQQEAGRGTAPFTAENMGILANNVGGLMGGMGPVTTGVASMAEMASGQPAGSLGGLRSFTGFRSIPMEKRGVIGNLVDYHDAAHAAQNTGNTSMSGGGKLGGGSIRGGYG